MCVCQIKNIQSNKDEYNFKMAHGSNVPTFSYDTLTLHCRKNETLPVAIGVQQNCEDMISQDKPFKQGLTICSI